MAFYPNTKITIGAYTFYGLHETEIHRSLHTHVEMGKVVLPATSRIRSKSRPADIKIVATADQFKEGDAVEVWLGYDNDLNREFKGFVRRVNKAVPCVVELEGYSYQLREKTKVNKFWKSTTVKEIMQEAVKGTDIKLMVADDMPVVNYMARNATGAQVLDDLIEKVSGKQLSAFFIAHDTLWIGLKYTNYASTVKYKIGYNVIKDNDLKERIINNAKLEIQFVHKNSKGSRVRGSAKTNGIGQVQKKTLTSIADQATLKKLAQAALDKKVFEGYEGTLTAFIRPFANPGDKCELIDPFFNRSGGFIIDTVKVKLNSGGARRMFEIGYKL